VVHNTTEIEWTLQEWHGPKGYSARAKDVIEKRRDDGFRLHSYRAEDHEIPEQVWATYHDGKGNSFGVKVELPTKRSAAVHWYFSGSAAAVSRYREWNVGSYRMYGDVHESYGNNSMDIKVKMPFILLYVYWLIDDTAV
jgi:hypothetical protein